MRSRNILLTIIGLLILIVGGVYFLTTKILMPQKRMLHSALYSFMVNQYQMVKKLTLQTLKVSESYTQ